MKPCIRQKSQDEIKPFFKFLFLKENKFILLLHEKLDAGFLDSTKCQSVHNADICIPFILNLLRVPVQISIPNRHRQALQVRFGYRQKLTNL